MIKLNPGDLLIIGGVVFLVWEIAVPIVEFLK